MSQLSDDDSSDSSNEFLVPADKIDLDSSFFAQKTNNLQTNPVVEEDTDDSEDEFDYSNDGDVSSAELLAQVLKNLQNTKAQIYNSNLSQSEPSTSSAPEQHTLDSKNNDLSKEISDLLLQGESEKTLSKQEDDENENDLETEEKTKYVIPQSGVQIVLPGENLMFDRRKKKQQDLQKLLQAKINKRIRDTQVFVHKVGLLAWLSHGFFLNELANDPELLAIALSLVSPNNYPKGRPDLKYLEKFTTWFGGIFKISDTHKQIVFSIDSLKQRIKDKNIENYIELVLLYIATVRGMGINCRLVISFQPPPLKPRPEQLFKIPSNEESNVTAKKSSKNKNENKEVTKGNKNKSTKKTKSKSKEPSDSPAKIIPENSPEALKTANIDAKKKAAAILKGKLGTNSLKNKKSKTSKDGESQDSSKDNEEDLHKNDSDDTKNMTIARKLRLRKLKEPEGANESDESEYKTTIQSKVVKLSRKTNSSPAVTFSTDESEYSTDDEYIEKKPKKRKMKQTNETIASKLAKKLLSSDEEESNTPKNKFNIWIEVYVESEESWICVNILDKKIHCASELYKKASDPVLYIIAWNSDGRIKDVTRRYCPHWLTDTRKKRVDENWWKDTLSEWKEKKTAMSKAEDEELLQRELEQPLPKTISECKGHPLYVLIRHLLKFEALYPPDVVPLGHLKNGEAVYSRHCVHTLYSRETWVKRARVVKPSQEAYKIVKSMPKYDKLSRMKIKDQPLELFGRWQTTPYVPPEAKDGKVPRNEYGNVDLFKRCMLPKGTAYINLPGLTRIARKLDIDCAPACVGFNFGRCGALPAFEGFVVCEEYEDTIREAWEQEQIEAQKRAIEKREKRIYGNWKKLIKGLLIRVRLAEKYNFKDDEEEVDFSNNEAENSRNVEKNATVKNVSKKSTKTAAMTKRGKQDPGNIKKKVKK